MTKTPAMTKTYGERELQELEELATRGRLQEARLRDPDLDLDRLQESINQLEDLLESMRIDREIPPAIYRRLIAEVDRIQEIFLTWELSR